MPSSETTKYVRGRVAITLPSSPSQLDEKLRVHALATVFFQMPYPRIHIGHVRTLLLGEQHCRAHGIPFHIRIDGDWTAAAYRLEAWIDLLHCIAWFGIKADLVYRHAIRAPADSWFEGALGADVWDPLREKRDELTDAGCDSWNLYADDFAHFPSLLIRGQEFETPRDYDVDWPEWQYRTDPMKPSMAFERAIYKAVGMERPQLMLPMVGAPTTAKVSKSFMSISWDVLKSASAQDARAYIMATAANPLDPLAAIGKDVDTNDLNPMSHTWSWEQWGEFIRQT